MLRRYTFKLYPTSQQLLIMEAHRRIHCDLYNACLAQRIDQWRHETQANGRIFGVVEVGPDRLPWNAGRNCLPECYPPNKWINQTNGRNGYDQGKEISAIRHEVDGAGSIGSTSLAQTIARVDKAFKAFFARAKAGARAQSGYPRFKRWQDYPGFSVLNPRSKPKKDGSLRWNGWSWTPDASGRNGRVTVMGILGAIKARGALPSRPEQIIGADFIWRQERWWMSLIVEMVPRRRGEGEGTGEIKFDLVDCFARVRRVDGGLAAGPEETVFAAADGRIGLSNERVRSAPGWDPRSLGADQGSVMILAGSDPRSLGADQGASAPLTERSSGSDPRSLGADQGVQAGVVQNLDGSDPGDLDHLQQAMARCKRHSNRYRKLRQIKARRQAAIARRRHESLHVWTTSLVRRFGALIVIASKIKEATKKGSGCVDNWGANVEAKAALNRHVLMQAPASALAMISYKAEERGMRCDHVTDDAPNIAIGEKLVAAGKQLRKAKRAIRRKGR